MTTTRRPKRGEEIELVVAGLDAKSRPFGRLGPRRVHLDRGAPGATVRAVVSGAKRGVLQARRVATLDRGPDGAEPRCAHFGVCGGCAWQDLAYEAQLAALAGWLEDVLPDDVPLEPVIGCDDPWAYRNKMDFTFASHRWVLADEPEDVDASFALGLHVPGRWDKVLDVEHCDIAFPEANAVVATARRLGRAHGLAPWDARASVGLLRHLVLRKGFATGELLAYLVTSAAEPGRVDRYAAELVAAHPELTTLVVGTREAPSAVAVGDEERVLHGPGVIHERLGGLEFTISPASFFQTNTAQAERLVALVREEAQAGPDDVVLDLYCGGGTFALTLAHGVREVRGLELVESAIADARRNADANGITNATFVAGDVVQTLAADEGAAPDVIVVDPPRAGLHPRVRHALARLPARRLVYVSCNPRVAAGDVTALVHAGYTVERARPVDLFPHTPHVECVLTLTRTEAAYAAALSGLDADG